MYNIHIYNHIHTPLFIVVLSSGFWFSSPFTAGLAPILATIQRLYKPIYLDKSKQFTDLKFGHLGIATRNFMHLHIYIYKGVLYDYK